MLPEQTVTSVACGVAGRGVTLTITVLRLLIQDGVAIVAAST